ncbi:MAG: hypothetical protein ABL908_19255 [Hyphomicrobium sp.]
MFSMIGAALTFMAPNWLNWVMPRSSEAALFDGTWRQIPSDCAASVSVLVLGSGTILRPIALQSGVPVAELPTFDVLKGRDKHGRRVVRAESGVGHISAYFTETQLDLIRFTGFYYTPERAAGRWVVAENLPALAGLADILKPGTYFRHC